MLGLERLLKSNPYPSRNLTRLFLFYFPDQRIFALVCFLMPIFPPLFFAVFFHFPLDFLFADFFRVVVFCDPLQGHLLFLSRVLRVGPTSFSTDVWQTVSDPSVALYASLFYFIFLLTFYLQTFVCQYQRYLKIFGVLLRFQVLMSLILGFYYIYHIDFLILSLQLYIFVHDLSASVDK